VGRIEKRFRNTVRRLKLPPLSPDVCFIIFLSFLLFLFVLSFFTFLLRRQVVHLPPPSSPLEAFYSRLHFIWLNVFEFCLKLTKPGPSLSFAPTFLFKSKSFGRQFGYDGMACLVNGLFCFSLVVSSGSALGQVPFKPRPCVDFFFLSPPVHQFFFFLVSAMSPYPTLSRFSIYPGASPQHWYFRLHTFNSTVPFQGFIRGLLADPSLPTTFFCRSTSFFFLPPGTVLQAQTTHFLRWAAHPTVWPL